jgi:effector-binding domain-containing protein
MLILILSALTTVGSLVSNPHQTPTLKAMDQYLISPTSMPDTPKTTVSVEKLVLAPMTILYIRDTARLDEISIVFGKDYPELFQLIGTNGLRPGKVMAFYHQYSDPIVLEVAVEVDKVPSNLSGRVMTRTIRGGDALVAHYKGPYERMDMPYNAITQWLKDNGKQPDGLPFEAYLNDPNCVKNKYELLTDVYQLLK